MFTSAGVHLLGTGRQAAIQGGTTRMQPIRSRSVRRQPVIIAATLPAVGAVLAGVNLQTADDNAARTVFAAIPNRLAIYLMGTPSARCRRRISAQSSTFSTLQDL
jgi:hypothetical protein